MGYTITEVEQLKKVVGIASAVAAAAIGTGVFLMMSKDTKKKMAKAIGSAKDDAVKVINKMS